MPEVEDPKESDELSTELTVEWLLHFLPFWKRKLANKQNSIKILPIPGVLTISSVMSLPSL